MITIPALSPMSTTEALPTTTPAPASSHKAMPYAHMTAGGYSSMACGYGYKKDDKGYCRPESWRLQLSIISPRVALHTTSTATHTATIIVTYIQPPMTVVHNQPPDTVIHTQVVTHTQQVTYVQTSTTTQVQEHTQTETVTQVVPTTAHITQTQTHTQTLIHNVTRIQTELVTKTEVQTATTTKAELVTHTVTATYTQVVPTTVKFTDTYTETKLVPTAKVSTAAAVIEHTLTATLTATQANTATATATAIEKQATEHATITQVHTQVVGATKTLEHTLTSVMAATVTQTSVETVTATATATQVIHQNQLSSCPNMCTQTWSVTKYLTTATSTTHTMATSTTDPHHGCGSSGCGEMTTTTRPSMPEKTGSCYGMDVGHPIVSHVKSISFSFLSSQDVRRISVKQVVNPVLLDDLNRPNIGGLYDPALGPSERGDVCATCCLNSFSCPGHFGHIELPSPVFHPLFMINMLNLLRGVCMWCHQFKMAGGEKVKYEAKLMLLERGLLSPAVDVDQFILRPGTKDEYSEPGETLVEFRRRVELFVHHNLKDVPASTRNDYKDGPVYQARKEVIQSFMKAALACKKCAHCDGYGYTFRKDGHTRIVEYDLSRKQKSLMEAMGKVRPNVLVLERASRNSAPFASEYSSRDKDGDVEMDDARSEPEPAGESTFEDREANDLPRSVTGAVKTLRGRNERVVPPEEARAHLRRLFTREPKITTLIYGRHGPFAPNATAASADMFFMDVLPVPPTRFRPPARMGDSIFEHPQNELLTKVLVTAYRLRDLEAALREASKKPTEGGEVDELGAAEEGTRKKLFGQLLESLIQLQVDVNSFMDSSKNPTPVRQGKLPTAGVKQGLEKKEGLFRKHMMGKRVNYAARSVISPDVNIETNEIGIPPVFARKLTFPEPVTAHNVKELRQAVVNGTAVYPGASIVQNEDGGLVYLDRMEPDARAALAARLLTPQEGPAPNSLTHRDARGKTVYRHLRDGDILILNRQPTLHKPSMMAHKAKVLKGEKTIRMHYANCNSYNADFDGDEMNIHFAQNHVARSEAIHIANTDHQYLAATSGDPLRGLIQDHVVAGVWMTNKSTMFGREEYYQLLYGALRPESDYSGQGRVRTLPPAIWKPRPLWTGKQIISTLLLNITPPDAGGLTLTSKGKVGNEHWGPHSNEETVIFYDGELLCGVLDKSQFGASAYGFVHSVYELYGPEIAGRLLSILSRLFTKFLQHRAFTCRMDDLALTPEGDARRAKILQGAKAYGHDAAVENFPSLDGASPEECNQRLPILLEEVLRDDTKMANLDLTVKKKMTTVTEAVTKACMPHGLLRKFPDNHMQTMTMSGAKGSAVNARQISCGLGQQELEGRRVPTMVSGKTLPAFRAFETAAIAGGYIASRFLTGIRPQEFYFHCMAGREGLIDTAVKTSRSGYLQRCLIKHLEGLKVHYDGTVRGSDAAVLQFAYGGDGLDVTRQKHLLAFGSERKKLQNQLFEFALRNERAIRARLNVMSIQGRMDEHTAAEHMKKALKKPHKYPPTMSIYRPNTHIGSTSEAYAAALDAYVKENPHKLIQPRKKDEGQLTKWQSRQGQMPGAVFKMLMNVRYLKSLAEPGEAVGLLASQGCVSGVEFGFGPPFGFRDVPCASKGADTVCSVGEPSTQMTLNTFHFAGHGAANVTLGIPRLREIVMTASTKPKTPTMTLPLLIAPTTIRPPTAEQITLFTKHASRLTLAAVISHVTVRESLSNAHRTYAVQITFYPSDECEAAYGVSRTSVARAISNRFGLVLRKEVITAIKKAVGETKDQIGGVGKGRAVRDALEGAGGVGADDDAEVPEGEMGTGRRDDASEIGDGDADEIKRKSRTQEAATYSDDESEEGSGVEPEIGADEIEAAVDANEDDDKLFIDLKPGKGAEAKKEKAKRKGEDEWNVPPGLAENFADATKFGSSLDFAKDQCTFDLEFSSSTPKLLLVGILEQCMHKTIVHEIPSITSVHEVKEPDPKHPGQFRTKHLETTGSNFPGIWAAAGDVVDLNSITSNDIHAILCAYGVEMARTAILKEIESVFSVYKIAVDFRHLTLIADYMTFDGGYKPFNRRGISTHSSPLLKASFETTAAFLSDATLYGDFDDLTSPSGNIVLGRPTQCGTGIFSVGVPTA
ncbi:DNA-directed RNA polymerase [Ceratobasidium theobromae]|uniref:DNA-directed RNA polymerase subunit n=1 Tax=Ceratobasidium theobromae TaxID=1582974 RepID=A0A5N5QJP3_9AGAM|nr:DNA-directed RNA polymerase [Ceratobasidium theobromae]